MSCNHGDSHVPFEDRMAVAHLSCRSLTVMGNYCRRCGKALTANNTILMDNGLLPEEYKNFLYEEGQIMAYENLDDVIEYKQKS